MNARPWLARYLGLVTIYSTLGCTQLADEPLLGSDPPGGEPAPETLLATPLGATTDPSGTTFRLWAPTATAVSVQGDFGPSAVAMTLLGAGSPGVWAVRVAAAHAGHRYRYQVTAKDGRVLTRIDPYGRQVKDGQSVIVDPAAYRWTTAPYVRPGKNQLVVYELHVGSFNCLGDSTRCGFAAVTARLDYLQNLGINVIELMPANSNGSPRGWGYNPHGYFAPHAPYGTPDELRTLVEQAKGIKDAALMRRFCEAVREADARWADAAD